MKYKVKNIKFGLAVTLKKRTTFHFSEDNPRWNGLEAIADFDRGCCFVTNKKTGNLTFIPMQGNVVCGDLGERLDGTEPSNVARSAILSKARAVKAAKKAS